MDIITSRVNDAVLLIKSLMTNIKFRRETGLFAVEGDHLCGELAERSDLISFLYTEKAARKYPETVKKAVEKAQNAAVIAEEISQYISDTICPQGLFASAKLFNLEIPENAKKLIVLDSVQDPGNVGTIIRAAEAFGIDGVLYSPNCADKFSPKTLRASMGSVFRVPVQLYSDAENLRGYLRGFTAYGAMLDETAKRLGEVKFPEKTAMVIGNEGSGISPEIAALCNEKIYIPIQGAESLNAAMAASILLWELSK